MVKCCKKANYKELSLLGQNIFEELITNFNPITVQCQKEKEFIRLTMSGNM